MTDEYENINISDKRLTYEYCAASDYWKQNPKPICSYCDVEKKSYDMYFIDERSNYHNGAPLVVCNDCADKIQKQNGKMSRRSKYCEGCGIMSTAIASDKWNDEEAHLLCYDDGNCVLLCVECMSFYYYNK